MNGSVEIVLLLAAVGYLLIRRMSGEPAQARRMLILSAVLTPTGLSDVSRQAQDPLSPALLIAAAVVSILLGALRGASVRISHRGLAFVGHTGSTVGRGCARRCRRPVRRPRRVPTQDVGLAGNSLLFTPGVGILTEGLVILYRALYSSHRVMWAPGQDGAPDRISRFLDNLRHNLTHHRPAQWNTRTERLSTQRR